MDYKNHKDHIHYYDFLSNDISYTFGGIPKIVHQTWKDENIPEEWKKSKEQWLSLHPDWKYMLWTDKDIRNHIKDYYPEFLQLHDNYEYNIQRADMIRYFVLYDFGGVYSDLDIYPMKNIDKYLKYDLDYFVYSANSDVILNSFMICRKYSPIMKNVQDNLKKEVPWYAIGKHLKVYYSTGPFLLHNTLLNMNDTELFIILPRKFFNPYSIIEDKNITENYQKLVLNGLEGGSWNSIDTQFYNFVAKHKTFFISFGILSILFIIIFLIYYMFKYKKTQKYCENVFNYCKNVKNTCKDK